MIPFNVPCTIGTESDYISSALKNNKFSGDGKFNTLCTKWLEDKLGTLKAFLTPSGTHALEMAALLSDIGPGDEVILPSFTFTSTANAFLLFGAQLVFVDIKPESMNIDEDLIESAITEKTKVIVPVHYGGFPCNMNTIMALAEKYNLIVVEDSAQGIMSMYKSKSLGTIGHFGCLSFHETKNIQCGEGGALLVNDPVFVERAEIISEKGTNRTLFRRGALDKYTWVDIGSSYLLSELCAAFLYPQLQSASIISARRRDIWLRYYNNMLPLRNDGFIDIPVIERGIEGNGHIFFIKVKDTDIRTQLINFLSEQGVMAVFHYIPLHSTEIGSKRGRFHGQDIHTTKESGRLLRLPLWYGIQDEQIDYVTQCIYKFFKKFKP